MASVEETLRLAHLDLVPIVRGILLPFVTELSFNVFGFCAALFGCLATSTKTILAESVLHGYKFDRYYLISVFFLFFYFLFCMIMLFLFRSLFFVFFGRFCSYHSRNSLSNLGTSK